MTYKKGSKALLEVICESWNLILYRVKNGLNLLRVSPFLRIIYFFHNSVVQFLLK